ncbi:unnamed protein product [Amoebophrya sp. A120]|nr:unnamed protein product [Amoebophrya sp. A120]|eukprot:GSA120T00019102001.1
MAPPQQQLFARGGGGGSSSSSRESKSVKQFHCGYLPHRISTGPLLNDGHTRLFAVSSFSDATSQKNQIQVLGFDDQGTFHEVLGFGCCFPANSLAWWSNAAGDASSNSILLSASDCVRLYSVGPEALENEGATAVRELKHSHGQISQFCAPVTGVATSSAPTYGPNPNASMTATAASCDIHGYVYVWDLEYGKQMSKPIETGMPLYDIAFDPTTRSHIAVAGPGQIGLYDIREPSKGLCLIDPPPDSHAAGPGRLAWGRDLLAATWYGAGTQFGMCVYDPRACVNSVNFRSPCVSSADGDAPVESVWMTSLPLEELEKAPSPTHRDVRQARQRTLVSGQENKMMNTVRMRPADCKMEKGTGMKYDMPAPITAVAVLSLPRTGTSAIIGSADEFIRIAPIMDDN